MANPYRKDIPPLLPTASDGAASAILGAMLGIAEAGGAAASDADRRMVAGAAHYIFGRDGLTPAAGGDLAAALAGSGLAAEAAKFLAVMAFVDGSIDKAKVAAVLAQAAALGVRDGYLDLIREAADGKLQEALAGMTSANMLSITGKPWAAGDINKWLTPYADAPDPALAARFEALGRLGEETFGHAFYVHFKENGYDFPGEPKGLNGAFSVPHDSTHTLSGFNTKPHGELLVSTFTSTMHPFEPMAGHVLPVIFSWHLQVQINDVAKHYKGNLDPDLFWMAWAAGAATKADIFGHDWDFWGYTTQPLVDLRRRFGIPAEGLG